MAFDPKKKDVTERIANLEDALSKAQEYLENDSHADWQGFRALFTPKMKDGKEVPPHKDWVKNVFIPNTEKALAKAEEILERLE